MQSVRNKNWIVRLGALLLYAATARASANAPAATCSTETRLKKIGIYGGSFDPIHHGHLILAREALETLDLEEVIFVLAAQSPHKALTRPTGAAVRWEMLTRCDRRRTGFSASRLEIDRPPPSYSIDTVEQLRAEKSDAKFFFLVGEDNLRRFQVGIVLTNLSRLVQFVVLDRSGASRSNTRYRVVRRRIDISATTIRNRVASGPIHSLSRAGGSRANHPPRNNFTRKRTNQPEELAKTCAATRRRQKGGGHRGARFARNFDLYGFLRHLLWDVGTAPESDCRRNRDAATGRSRRAPGGSRRFSRQPMDRARLHAGDRPRLPSARSVISTAWKICGATLPA